MRIPERPQILADLDLMKRLKAYSEGEVTWHLEGQQLGQHERSACHELHANIIAFVERCLQPVLDRVTAREMQGFTMHDRGHGLKVAHLMWHLLKPERRQVLTPGEIALLVVSAQFHDIGMALNDDERKARLDEASDIWDKYEGQRKYLKDISAILVNSGKDGASEAIKAEAIFQLNQAQEALLCLDTRDRHATKARYNEIINMLSGMHKVDAINIPDVHSALSFDGDSFEDKLVDICISHNQDAHALLDRNPENFDQLRFPTKYPVGCCLVDTKLVASALRLADVLDFDRERTPAVLFHYLFPRSSNPVENNSIREWSKHLAISNWEIVDRTIIFRGRSPSALIHHAIVEFCRVIKDEIARTESVFVGDEWPFCVDANVSPVIEAIGYHYVPYRFSLDEERIYKLLMGRNIYDDRLFALRELIQNSIDACKLRDALMLCHDKSVSPSRNGRIIIRYQEPSVAGSSVILSVIDTGIGMSRYVLENYFLKVGRSYYDSRDFLETRSILRKEGFDFKPVSEFGIGFLSVFMLGERVEVETSPYFPDPDESQRRLLRIDGVGRLIEVTEQPNASIPRYFGTRVSIHLSPKVEQEKIPTWEEVERNLRDVCVNLDYPLVLQHITRSKTIESEIVPSGLGVPISAHLAEAAYTIPVDAPELGIRGEIVFFREHESRVAEQKLANQNPVRTVDELSIRRTRGQARNGILLRGGFVIGGVPGLPDSYPVSPDARVEVSRDEANSKYLPATNLARSALVEASELERNIFKIWLDALMLSVRDIEKRPIGSPSINSQDLSKAAWLQKYDAFHVYRLARACWASSLERGLVDEEKISNWEKGKGEPLFVAESQHYQTELHWAIFSLILPKICKLVVGPVKYGYAYFLAPPAKGWQTALKKWNTYINDGVAWGRFAIYANSAANILFECSSRIEFLNVQYKDRFVDFTGDELLSSIESLDRLVASNESGRQLDISASELDLLNRFLTAAKDLKIRRFNRVIQLKELST